MVNDNDFLELKTATQKSFYIKVNSKNSLNLYTSENKNKQGSITKEKLNKQVNGHQEFDGWEGYVNGVIEYLKTKHNLEISGNSIEKKYVLILLLCIHFYMLFSQLVYWMLDINYGDLYYIGESLFSRTKIGYDAVESLYNQIMFGMYYSILSSIILILLIRKYYKK